jgi:hypothetical protein
LVSEAENVQELDKALLQKKEKLSNFQSEYLQVPSPSSLSLTQPSRQAKENYERALKNVQFETERVEELIEKREYSYGSPSPHTHFPS